MNNYEIIDNLLSSCSLSSALPDAVRAEMMKSKKSVLVNILKETGKYTIVTALLINIIILLKKFGIGISAVKMGVVINVAAAVTASSIAVGTGAVAYRHFHHAAEPIPQVLSVSREPEIKTKERITAPVSRHYAIEMLPLSAEADLSGEASDFLRNVHSAIIGKSGSNAAVIQENNVNYSSRAVLSGTFSRINGLYHISIRLVDAESSQVLVIINKTAATTGELGKVPYAIADELDMKYKKISAP